VTASTAHVDTFVRDHLPPRELWPGTDWSGVPELAYPDQLNAAGPLLDDWIAHGRGNRPAIRYAGGTWSYRDLFETADRIAHVLVEDLGLVPGGRVLLRSPNRPMLVACWFAVLKAGGVAVTTMPLLRMRELADIVDQARVTLAITDARVAADLEAAMAGREGVRIVRFNGTDPGAPVALSLEAMMATKPDSFANVATAADDPAIIAFTSGTTGRSKGTVHTHRDLLAVADTYARYVLKPDADDIFIGSPPLAFTYALGGLVLFPMRFGASTALIEQASPPLLLEGIQKFRATITITSPTAYRAMLAQAGEYDLTSLRKCVSAGETLPAATFNAWEKATGIRLMDGIGSTEMLHMFIGSPAAAAKPGSTGTVVPGFKARVVDDHGRDVPIGTVGRLAVSGPTGCRYLGDIANQRRYVQHGWNLTGDAYRQDADGYFWYVSRTDDMIITAGYNVSGPEVENVLLTHPAVAECAVVGIADEARGHIVKAFVVPAAGRAGSDTLARELQDFVKRELAPYKYPRAIEFVAELPRTLTGKLQRYRLRAGTTGTTGTTDTTVQFHEPAGWAKPKGYANATSGTGRIVFVAGQVGWDPVTCVFAAGDFAAEVRQALANVAAALDAAGARPDQITRLTWYITDRDEYLRSRAEIGRVYREIIGRHFPAMSVVVVQALIEPGARVEIEATAVVR
jgi:2-aminobenzoate-CoA ligase